MPKVYGVRTGSSYRKTFVRESDAPSRTQIRTTYTPSLDEESMTVSIERKKDSFQRAGRSNGKRYYSNGLDSFLAQQTRFRDYSPQVIPNITVNIKGKSYLKTFYKVINRKTGASITVSKEKYAATVKPMLDKLQAKINASNEKNLTNDTLSNHIVIEIITQLQKEPGYQR